MQSWTRWGLLSLWLLLACGDDDQSPDAGIDAAAGSGGSAAVGGSAGTSGNGGTSGSGATGGSGGSGGSGGAVDAGEDSGVETGDCGPMTLNTAGATTVTPAQADELDQIVFDATEGTTLLLEDGTYAIDAILQVRRAGITIASASRDASRVIIDASYTVPEAFAISASNVTLAHITITRAVDHLVHAYTTGSDNITGLMLYDVTLIDSGEQFVKVNPGGGGGYIDNGRITCSRFLMTDEGRSHVEPCCGGCYTGGIDVHAGYDWEVDRNRFEGIYCDNGLAEHAIHFWKGSVHTTIQRNLIVDCARGIGLGLEGGSGERVYPEGTGEPHAHYGGNVNNNGIWAATPRFDTGIEIHDTPGAFVAHNTVVHAPSATGFYSSIDARFSATSAHLVNNLVVRITSRDNATLMQDTNLEQASPDWLADPAAFDFHLTSDATDAIDHGTPRIDLGLDLDGEPHDHGAPDIGADER